MMRTAYLLLRAYDNSRIQSALKVAAAPLFAGRQMLSPLRWFPLNKFLSARS
jgi:hypothetical protein